MRSTPGRASSSRLGERAAPAHSGCTSSSRSASCDHPRRARARTGLLGAPRMVRDDEYPAQRTKVGRAGHLLAGASRGQRAARAGGSRAVTAGTDNRARACSRCASARSERFGLRRDDEAVPGTGAGRSITTMRASVGLWPLGRGAREAQPGRMARRAALPGWFSDGACPRPLALLDSGSRRPTDLCA